MAVKIFTLIFHKFHATNKIDHNSIKIYCWKKTDYNGWRRCKLHNRNSAFKNSFFCKLTAKKAVEDSLVSRAHIQVQEN